MRAMANVADGLRSVHHGFLLVALAAVLKFFTICLAREPGNFELVRGLELLIVFLQLSGSAIGLIGRAQCLSVPAEFGAAKPLISISVAFELLGAFLELTLVADGLGGDFLPPEIRASGGLAALMFSVISTILFLLFVSVCARYVWRDDLAGKALSVLWLWMSIVVCIVLAMVFSLAGLGRGAGRDAELVAIGAWIVLGFTSIVLLVVALLRYSYVLRALRAECIGFAYNNVRRSAPAATDWTAENGQ
jgi:hypothetical protein